MKTQILSDIKITDYMILSFEHMLPKERTVKFYQMSKLH